MTARLASCRCCWSWPAAGAATPHRTRRPGRTRFPTAPTITCPANVAARPRPTTAQVAYPAPTDIRRPAAGDGGLHARLRRAVPPGDDERELHGHRLGRTGQATCSFSVTVDAAADAAAHELPGVRRQRHRGRGHGPDLGGLEHRGIPVVQADRGAGGVVSDAAAGDAADALHHAADRHRGGQCRRARRAGHAGRAALPVRDVAGAARGGAAARGLQRPRRCSASAGSTRRPRAIETMAQGSQDSRRARVHRQPHAAARRAAATRCRRTASPTSTRGCGRSRPAKARCSWISTRRSSSNVTLYIGVDGLHPTEVGYQRIAETFFTAIQASLENR